MINTSKRQFSRAEIYENGKEVKGGRQEQTASSEQTASIYTRKGYGGRGRFEAKGIKKRDGRIRIRSKRGGSIIWGRRCDRQKRRRTRRELYPDP
jgi:hypothetical protein